MFLKFLLLIVLGFMPASSFGTPSPLVVNKNPSFLIVGSSVPALVAGWVLSRNNVSVTISYSSANINNQYSTTTTTVQGVTYQLPKMQPVIFENSERSQDLVNILGKNLHAENGFYLYFYNNSYISLGHSTTLPVIVEKLVKVGCIKENEVKQVIPFLETLMQYNYSSYKLKYSNITLAQFAKLFKVPNSFMNCAINLLTLNSGMNSDNINAADALARIVFYYFNSKSPLRSYYIKGETIFGKPIKGLIDQIVDDMKLRNVKFISNHTTTAFYVDPDKGTILGDLSDRSTTYDFVILGDTLNNSRNILQRTYDDNTGSPTIFRPLDAVLRRMNKLSLCNDVASIKIWLSKRLFFQGHIIKVNNSPFPYSIQSINQLTLTSIEFHFDTVLEVIVVGTNGSKFMDMNKVFRELFTYMPDINMANIRTYRVDWIEMGVLMDTEYGNNRLTTNSIRSAGISNLFLSGDWLDAVNSTSADLERSIVIALQSLSG